MTVTLTPAVSNQRHDVWCERCLLASAMSYELTILGPNSVGRPVKHSECGICTKGDV